MTHIFLTCCPDPAQSGKQTAPHNTHFPPVSSRSSDKVTCSPRHPFFSPAVTLVPCQVGKLLQQHNVLGVGAGIVTQQVDDDVAETSILLWQLVGQGFCNSLQPPQLALRCLGNKMQSSSEVCLPGCRWGKHPNLPPPIPAYPKIAFSGAKIIKIRNKAYFFPEHIRKRIPTLMK